MVLEPSGPITGFEAMLWPAAPDRRELPSVPGIQWPNNGQKKDELMIKLKLIAMAAATGAILAASPAEAAGPTDPEIAHIAYTAGNIDIAAAKLALARSANSDVRAFASEMLRDHQAVNDKALALVKELHVTPAGNATSAALQDQADKTAKRLSQLSGAAFDRAYAANETAYHKAVNDALASTLIPSAANAQLKSLLETGLTLFREHQMHAQHLAAMLK